MKLSILLGIGMLIIVAGALFPFNKQQKAGKSTSEQIDTSLPEVIVVAEDKIVSETIQENNIHTAEG